MKPIFLALLLTTLASHAADPFTFQAPKDWRPERIPFPLGFAPELKYKGFEELRFGPGMFKPTSDSYWTYVFFWWIKGDVKLSAKDLQKDLDNYYRGLSRAVGGRRFKIDTAKVNSKVTALDPKNLADPHFSGTLVTYDAFATGKLINLNLEVSRRHYPKLDRTCYFFAVSPKAKTESVWQQMRTIGSSFKLK